MIHLLRVEIDGHHNGGPPIKPWAARIHGACPKFGLSREFIEPMNDWRNAVTRMSGKTYGVVATFPLRDGHIYEALMQRGKIVARQFYQVDGGKKRRLTVDEALALAEGDKRAARPLLLDADSSPHLAHIIGLGTPRTKAFALDGEARRYRLVEGDVYEVRGRTPGKRQRSFGPLIGVRDGEIVGLNETEAWSWLTL